MSNLFPHSRNINDIILHPTENSQLDVNTRQSQAQTDKQLISLWLHNRSIHTQKAYFKDIMMMFEFVNKGIRDIKLQDLQDFSDFLKQKNYEPSSQHRMLAAVKSLFSFAHKIGYIIFNTTMPLIIPKFKDRLAERILSEEQVKNIIEKENHPRNKLILRVFYTTGLRVSELCSLKWEFFSDKGNDGLLTIFTKGGKTNTIVIPQSLWMNLKLFKNNAEEQSYVFKGRKSKSLNPSQLWRIVRKAAQKAGIDKNVSCHWLRHCHSSHALDNGCPIHLIQRQLNHSSIATTGRYLTARPTESSSKYLNL